jgi:hypothetical protein
VVRAAPARRAAARAPRPLAFRSLDGGGPMILFVNPRATRPKNRRFPLSLMAIGAALPETVGWEIVDGNLPGADVAAMIGELVDRHAAGPDPVELVALTVMPGRNWSARSRCRRRSSGRCPHLPIVWGGNFGSLYPAPVLNAPASTGWCAGRASRPSSSCSKCCVASAIPDGCRPRLPRGRRHALDRPRARMGRPRRAARSALSQDRRRHLPPTDHPRPPLGGLSGVDRLSLCLQLLRA